jgi:hypothetical protein
VEEDPMEKKVYSRPKLEVLGKLTDLTQNGSAGTQDTFGGSVWNAPHGI